MSLIKSLKPGFFGLGFGFLLSRAWYLTTCILLGLDGLQKQYGLHFHHSLLATLPLLYLFFYRSKTSPADRLFLIALALGILLEHSLYDGFYFVTRLAFFPSLLHHLNLS